MHNIVIAFAAPPGAGKTTLTAAVRTWAAAHYAAVAVVSIDDFGPMYRAALQQGKSKRVARAIQWSEYEAAVQRTVGALPDDKVTILDTPYCQKKQRTYLRHTLEFCGNPSRLVWLTPREFAAPVNAWAAVVAAHSVACRPPPACDVEHVDGSLWHGANFAPPDADTVMTFPLLGDTPPPPSPADVRALIEEIGRRNGEPRAVLERFAAAHGRAGDPQSLRIGKEEAAQIITAQLAQLL